MTDEKRSLSDEESGEALRESEKVTGESYRKAQNLRRWKEQRRKAKKASEKAVKAAGAAVEIAGSGKRRKRRETVLAIIAVAAVLVLTVVSMVSCMAVGNVGFTALSMSTYPSDDGEMKGAESTYTAMEDALRSYIDTFEETHSYDEYRYDLDEMFHDPYVLISFLTAKRGDQWTVSEMKGFMDAVFGSQYELTETVTVETRYRREERTRTVKVVHGDGTETEETYSYYVDVPYKWYVCTVTLINNNLSFLPVSFLDEGGLERYAVYMATLGNRSDLFPESEYIEKYLGEPELVYDIPPEALGDETFRAMMEEAEKYIGYPYVFGGSNPNTSFDCSGFVSWVINHSGWDVGRLGATALCGICTPISESDLKPGDLVFFKGTYETRVPGAVSHCGIYVGNGIMLNAGDPIGYTNLGSAYWQEHLYAYGRLP